MCASFDLVTTDGTRYGVCKLCEQRLKYFWGTTNMKLHLQSHQTSSSSESSGKQTLDRFIIRSITPQRICPLCKTNSANELLVAWIWKNLRPSDIVEDSGLKSLRSFLELCFHVPTRTFISSQIKHADGDARRRRAQMFVTKGG